MKNLILFLDTKLERVQWISLHSTEHPVRQVPVIIYRCTQLSTSVALPECLVSNCQCYYLITLSTAGPTVTTSGYLPAAPWEPPQRTAPKCLSYCLVEMLGSMYVNLCQFCLRQCLVNFIFNCLKENNVLQLN